MTDEEKRNYRQAKKEKILALINKLSTLSDEQRGIIANQVHISNPEGRVLSSRNQMLIFLQAPDEVAKQLTVVAGIHQWKKYGRKVIKGQHGMMIAVPAIPKNEEGEESENNRDPEFFLYKSVFDVSQTEAF